MEDFGAQDWASDAFCEDKVGRCEIYVGIFGDAYGTQTAKGTSYTEREYEAAVKHGLPRLLFLSSNAGAKKHSKRTRRQVNFRSRAMAERLCQVGWSSRSDLALSVITALHNYSAQDQCAHRGSLVPDGLLRICLAMGLPQRDTQRRKCREYIRELSKLLKPKKYSLIYSATNGGNLATVLCKASIKFQKSLTIYSFVADEFENNSIPQTMPDSLRKSLPCIIGTKLPAVGMTREIRRVRMVESCDCCLLMAGMRATSNYFDLCRALAKPVIPILWSGGAAARIYADDYGEPIKELLKANCGHGALGLLNKLNNNRVSSKVSAKWTIELFDLIWKRKCKKAR